MLAEDGSTMTMQANIKADGAYALDFGADGRVEIVGKYKLDGDQVTVQDMPSGADGCTGVGVYRYEKNLNHDARFRRMHGTRRPGRQNGHAAQLVFTT